VTVRVGFMGSPEFAVPTLRALSAHFLVTGVVTQPDKQRGRGRKTVPTEVKAAALEIGLPLLQPEKMASPEVIQAVNDWSADFIVVVAYGKLLPQTILDAPHFGCVNLHGSLLPRHRGASPIAGAILAGDRVAGVTTMFMDQGMDTGDMLLIREVPIEPWDTTGSLHDKLKELGADLVVETLRGLLDGTVKPSPQDHSMATYTSLLTKQDGRLKWNLDAEYLDRQVRAMNPWPGAFVSLSGEIVKVWKVEPREGNGTPGRIEEISGDAIVAGTGNGLLALKEVQAAGKSRIAAAEFARGRRLKIGDCFE